MAHTLKPSKYMALLGFFMGLVFMLKLLKSAKKALKSTKKDQMLANMYAKLCE